MGHFNCFQEDQYSIEHQLRQSLAEIRDEQQIFSDQFRSFFSQHSSDLIYDLIELIYQLQMKSNEIEFSIDRIEHRLDEKTMDDDTINSLKNDINSLRNNVERLKTQFEEMKNHSSLSSGPLQRKQRRSQSTIVNSEFAAHEPVILSQSLPNAPIIRDYATENDLTELESIDFDNEVMINRKIRLANHFINWLRGPFRIIIDAPMRVAEVYTQRIHVSDAVTQAVNKGFARQQQMSNAVMHRPFAQITSHWIFERKNPDRGFSSESMWMRDPHGRHILVKIQDHPLCAANEWLAFILGRQLDLPVNEVQISIYENKLVTLHTDVTGDNEQAMTFINLPKRLRKILLTDPTIESMDFFDHILQNVDRNPNNILITMPKTYKSLDKENPKLKMFLIDHSSCFGMGKLNAISVMACKFHSQHLAVVKFDPVEMAKKFEQYLLKLPRANRILIRKTLNRFAATSNEQIDGWMNEIEDLLTPSQYIRIREVLIRQRDVAKRFIRFPTVKSKPVICEPHVEVTFL